MLNLLEADASPTRIRRKSAACQRWPAPGPDLPVFKKQKTGRLHSRFLRPDAFETPSILLCFKLYGEYSAERSGPCISSFLHEVLLPWLARVDSSLQRKSTATPAGASLAQVSDVNHRPAASLVRFTRWRESPASASLARCVRCAGRRFSSSALRPAQARRKSIVSLQYAGAAEGADLIWPDASPSLRSAQVRRCAKRQMSSAKPPIHPSVITKYKAKGSPDFRRSGSRSAGGCRCCGRCCPPDRSAGPGPPYLPQKPGSCCSVRNTSPCCLRG